MVRTWIFVEIWLIKFIFIVEKPVNVFFLCRIFEEIKKFMFKFSIKVIYLRMRWETKWTNCIFNQIKSPVNSWNNAVKERAQDQKCENSIATFFIIDQLQISYASIKFRLFILHLFFSCGSGNCSFLGQQFYLCYHSFDFEVTMMAILIAMMTFRQTQNIAI